MLMTTLHYASQNSQTETAMALVEAGADVNRKDSYGCGLRLYRRVVGLSQRRGRTMYPTRMVLPEGLFVCAGIQRCTMHR
jgi:hypothetical protein